MMRKWQVVGTVLFEQEVVPGKDPAAHHVIEALVPGGGVQGLSGGGHGATVACWGQRSEIGEGRGGEGRGDMMMTHRVKTYPEGYLDSWCLSNSSIS